MRLTREVRFSLAGGVADGPILNSWAGWPIGGSIAPFVILRATVSGSVNEKTGYLCNIAEIDRLLRADAIPQIQQSWEAAGCQSLPAAKALLSLWERLKDRSPNSSQLEALALASSPFLRFRADRGVFPMIIMTESFEFAASHRLACPDLDDERNREVFGKCSNPNGHGHNYVVEVSIAGEPDARTGGIMDHISFQRAVKEQVIDRFDHKHLNSDCPEFAELNPTVENITRVIWDRLVDRLAPAKLHAVRVYETPKTYAEYSGR